MRLSLIFDKGPGSPGMSDGSDDRLRARMDVDVLDNNPLLSAATKLSQRPPTLKRGDDYVAAKAWSA